MLKNVNNSAHRLHIIKEFLLSWQIWRQRWRRPVYQLLKLHGWNQKANHTAKRLPCPSYSPETLRCVSRLKRYKSLEDTGIQRITLLSATCATQKSHKSMKEQMKYNV